MYLQRKCSKRIIDWFNEENKALLITGARQVGKTHLIRHVVKEELTYHLFEINLIETPEAVSIISQSETVEDLRIGLSVFSDEKLIPGNTVIFIDEVQKCKEIITKIKFLAEDNTFKYILSGSLLGVELNNIESAPVGYLEIIRMYPMDFEEFLQISNISEDVINSLKSSFINRKPVMDAINHKMLELFRRYLLVGGMPEAVARFAESYNLNDVISIHNDIVNLYKLDFTKYETDDKKLLISNIYDLIPAELLKQNKRFIITDLKKGLRFERIENSFLWLQNAGVSLTAYNATEPRVPLLLNEKQSLFKLYLSDVGMLTSIYGMNTKSMILRKDSNINCGGIYENAVIQELVSKGFKVYYYNSNRLGALDFVIEYGGHTLPIEVKSGKDYTVHSAMNNCLKNKEYEMKEGIVFANCNVSVNGKVTYLPVYMSMFLTNDNDEDIILDKISF